MSGFASIEKLVRRFGALMLLARLCLAQTQLPPDASYKLEITVTASSANSREVRVGAT